MVSKPANDAPCRLIRDVTFGEGVIVQAFVNLYGCHIGDRTRIGPFVEIQKDVLVGSRCKISSHAFICTGVEIADEVFIGHGVTFTNDKYPRATTAEGKLQTDEDWALVRTIVGPRSSIGSGAVIIGGIIVGEGAVVGAGAVVTHDVPAGAIVAGNPARALRTSN